MSAAHPILLLYSAPGCHLCEDALATLRRLQAQLRFELQVRDITGDDALHRAYLERIPVGVLGSEELFEYFVDEERVRQALQGPGAAPR